MAKMERVYPPLLFSLSINSPFLVCPPPRFAASRFAFDDFCFVENLPLYIVLVGWSLGDAPRL